jgi:hypothetical protein
MALNIEAHWHKPIRLKRVRSGAIPDSQNSAALWTAENVMPNAELEVAGA